MTDYTCICVVSTLYQRAQVHASEEGWGGQRKKKNTNLNWWGALTEDREKGNEKERRFLPQVLVYIYRYIQYSVQVQYEYSTSYSTRVQVLCKDFIEKHEQFHIVYLYEKMY